MVGLERARRRYPRIAERVVVGVRGTRGEGGEKGERGSKFGGGGSSACGSGDV